MEITGILKQKDDVQTFGTNGFSVCQILLETDEKYPQVIPVKFVQDKSDLPQPYNIGEEITVSINIRGSEYNGKNYSEIQGWKIQRKNG